MFAPKPRINYSKTIEQAEKINSLADDLKNVAIEVENIINELPNIWNSESSKEFLTFCATLKENIDSTSVKMKSVSSKISTAADELDAEYKEAKARYDASKK